MQSTGKNIIVKLDKEYEDTVTYKKLVLQIDPLFNPTNYLRFYGTVVGVSDLVPDLNFGDVVYFHYIANHPERYVDYRNLLLKVDYDLVFCKIQDGIQAVGSWSICKEVVEENVSDLGDGTQGILKNGLVVSLTPKLSALKSEMVSTPDNSIAPGTHVHMDAYCEFVNIIEDGKYYCIRTENILSTVTYT